MMTRMRRGILDMTQFCLIMARRLSELMLEVSNFGVRRVSFLNVQFHNLALSGTS